MGTRRGSLLVSIVAIVAATACGTQDGSNDRRAEERIAAVPMSSVEDEVELLRWLERDGRLADIVAVLDASMVTVPSGWGPMGTDFGRSDEAPARSIWLDEFRLDRYEVTNLQYAAFVDDTGADIPPHWDAGTFPAGTPTHPIVGVSWAEADAYCRWAGKRLPTEAEWERACRGPDGSTFPWGTRWDPDRTNVTMLPLDAPAEGWVVLDHQIRRSATVDGPELLPVGSPPGNESSYGVCNLGGNVSEWVADWYDRDAYAQLPDVNPLSDGPPWNRAVRGNAWLFRHPDAALLIDQSRCAFRNASHSVADPRTGFRCADQSPGAD